MLCSTGMINIAKPSPPPPPPPPPTISSGMHHDHGMRLRGAMLTLRGMPMGTGGGRASSLVSAQPSVSMGEGGSGGGLAAALGTRAVLRAVVGGLPLGCTTPAPATNLALAKLEAPSGEAEGRGEVVAVPDVAVVDAESADASDASDDADFDVASFTPWFKSSCSLSSRVARNSCDVSKDDTKQLGMTSTGDYAARQTKGVKITITDEGRQRKSGHELCEPQTGQHSHAKHACYPITHATPTARQDVTMEHQLVQ